MEKLTEIDDSQLEQVSGGAGRSINTHTDSNAQVRSGPGMENSPVASLHNGTRVNITGEAVENFSDGRMWYKIDYPVDGWIPENLLER